MIRSKLATVYSMVRASSRRYNLEFNVYLKYFSRLTESMLSHVTLACSISCQILDSIGFSETVEIRRVAINELLIVHTVSSRL